MDAIRIVPTAEKYAAGVCHAVDVVARARRYLCFVEGPPLEASLAFIQALIAGAGVQFLAIDNDDARIELEVFSSNEHAVALYRKLGFQVEGVKRRARRLDGDDDDIVFMALLRDDGA